MPRVLGIDEAGRGAVIGPLVIAGVTYNDENKEKLESIGVKDSKLLSKKQREELFTIIVNGFEHKIIKLSPAEIDDALASETMNLNKLEMKYFGKLISHFTPAKSIIDSPSANLSAAAKTISFYAKTDTELVVEHKADFNHPVVAAASILAKVTRDKEVEKLEKLLGKTIGSGYPSDPFTKAFLRDYDIENSKHVRKSWATVKTLLAGKAQKKLFDY